MSSERKALVRARLLEGMALAVADRGFAASTIADIVRQARLSKRTFYEHFADKEECYLALFTDASERTTQSIGRAVDPAAPVREQIRAASRAYLRSMESAPELTRSFLLELPSAGERALATRRVVHEHFGEVVRGFLARARKHHASLRPLSSQLATALVAGINELVMLRAERGEAAHLTPLTDVVADFVLAVATTPRE